MATLSFEHFIILILIWYFRCPAVICLRRCPGMPWACKRGHPHTLCLTPLHNTLPDLTINPFFMRSISQRKRCVCVCVCISKQTFLLAIINLYKFCIFSCKFWEINKMYIKSELWDINSELWDITSESVCPSFHLFKLKWFILAQHVPKIKLKGIPGY